MSPTSYRAAPSRVNIKEDVGFEPTHAFTRLTVFKTVPFSRTWVILQIYSPYGIRTRVTAVKRRCLNPLTNGPYILKMGTSGLEPPTSRLSGVRSNHLSYAPKLKNLVMNKCSKRVTRIELATTAWKAVVLPLNYTRLKKWELTGSNR